MEILVTENVIDTVRNSLIDSKQNLLAQLSRATKEDKKEILAYQLAEVEEALRIFDQVQ